LGVPTDDGRDVEVSIRGGGFVDPFADERRDRDMRVDAVKGAQREVEILAKVAQREHRRFVPVLEVTGAANGKRRHESREDVEGRRGVEPGALSRRLELRGDEDERAEPAVGDELEACAAPERAPAGGGGGGDERRNPLEHVGPRRAHLDEAVSARCRERPGGATKRRAERVGSREARDDDGGPRDGVRGCLRNGAGADGLGARARRVPDDQLDPRVSEASRDGRTHASRAEDRNARIHAAPFHERATGPEPAAVCRRAPAIAARSDTSRSSDPAAIQPSTCSGLRAPTMAPVTPGDARVQATATADTVTPWRSAMGRSASRSAMLRERCGSVNSEERRRQSSSAIAARRCTENVSVSRPDCIGLYTMTPVRWAAAHGITSAAASRRTRENGGWRLSTWRTDSARSRSATSKFDT